MTTPTQEQLEALWNLCENKLNVYRIHNEEALTDLDQWEPYSYYWLCEIGDIVGWKPSEEEDA
jgi:hypothetical protein